MAKTTVVSQARIQAMIAATMLRMNPTNVGTGTIRMIFSSIFPSDANKHSAGGSVAWSMWAVYEKTAHQAVLSLGFF